MRKVFAILAVVLVAAVAGPEVAMAAAKPTAGELLVLKKKKAEGLRKAKAQPAAVQQKTGAASRRSCGSFLHCLFGGSRRNPNVRPASSAPGFDDGDYETAKVVSWNGASKYAPGSIIVRTPERALYYVLGDGQARRYKVGVGREGFQWSGNSRIVAKQEWPTWRPPQVMIEREAAKGHMLPDIMEGGPENPLGARAMYIGGTMFRIHGTNNSASIGGAVSSGCIRMMNSDVMDLYERVRIGAKVYVYQ